MHPLPHLADRGVRRHRGDHGNHLQELHLREHRRGHLGHRHGIHRRRPDDRRALLRGGRDGPLRDRDEPTGSASHRGSGEEASSRGSDAVRPDPVQVAVRPGRVPDGYPLQGQRDAGHPDRARDVHRRAEVLPEPDAELDAPPVPTSTGCYRPAVPWGLVWDRGLRAWARTGQARRHSALPMAPDLPMLPV